MALRTGLAGWQPDTLSLCRSCSTVWWSFLASTPPRASSRWHASCGIQGEGRDRPTAARCPGRLLGLAALHTHPPARVRLHEAKAVLNPACRAFRHREPPVAQSQHARRPVAAVRCPCPATIPHPNNTDHRPPPPSLPPPPSTTLTPGPQPPPPPSLRAPFATVMPFGYAGGPVVAEAMKDLYAPDSFGYPDGYPLALLAATVGMFVGVIAGAVLVNLAPLGIGLGGAAAARAEEAPGRQARCHRGGGGGGGAVVGTPIQTERPRGSLMKRLKKSMKDLAATAPDSDHFSAAVRAALMRPFPFPSACRLSTAPRSAPGSLSCVGCLLPPFPIFPSQNTPPHLSQTFSPRPLASTSGAAAAPADPLVPPPLSYLRRGCSCLPPSRPSRSNLSTRSPSTCASSRSPSSAATCCASPWC